MIIFTVYGVESYSRFVVVYDFYKRRRQLTIVENMTLNLLFVVDAEFVCLVS